MLQLFCEYDESKAFFFSVVMLMSSYGTNCVIHEHEDGQYSIPSEIIPCNRYPASYVMNCLRIMLTRMMWIEVDDNNHLALGVGIDHGFSSCVKNMRPKAESIPIIACSLIDFLILFTEI